MIYKIDKNIIIENSSAFSLMMRNNNISGIKSEPQDIHKMMLVQSGKDVESDALSASKNITNKALNIDYAEEKKYAIRRAAKGL